MILPRGLYAIADTTAMGERDFAATVADLLAGGAVMLQYRDKSDDDRRRRQQAGLMVEQCRDQGAVAVINDDVTLAAASGADGVHLGADDADPAAARRDLGDDAVIGVSCYDNLDRALRAAAAGADYLAFGRAWPSTTKPGGPRASPQLMHRARRQTGLPVCAIGGITPENVAPLVRAGVDLVAVIGGLYSGPDPAARARDYVDAIRSASAPARN